MPHRRFSAVAACAAIVLCLSGGPVSPRPDGISVRAVDGGPHYYAGFSNPLPDDPDFFPLAVWYESVGSAADVEANSSAGINTYLELSEGADLDAIRAAGSYAVMGWTDPRASGALLGDEVDMWAGAGDAAWSGNYPGQGGICEPGGSGCGYTIQQQWAGNVEPGTMVYANYGKGITFWLSDEEAARFAAFPDVVSADAYWFTDPNICDVLEGGELVDHTRDLTEQECRRAANYGWTTARVRSLVEPAGSKPVWNFVEVALPSEETGSPGTTPEQIRAAVWSSIISGARGIAYFTHSFGGTCPSANLLRSDCAVPLRDAVTEVNAQVADLAPVLNAPFIDGLASAEGIDTAVKVYDGSLYVLAASAGTHPQTQATIHLACGGSNTTAEVLGEGRTVPVNGAAMVDTFADSTAVHLYRLPTADQCGL